MADASGTDNDPDDDTPGNPLVKRATWMEWAGLTNRYSHPSIETTESDTLKEMYGGDGSKFDPMNNPLGSAPASSSRTQHSKLADVSIDSSRTKTPLQRARPRLLTCLRCVLVANTQISVVVVCFTIYYTYCISMNKVFNQHDIWQACFVRAGRFGVEEDTSFLQSAAALGLQVIVYSFAAIGIVMSALVNQALLPSTIPMVVYDALAILSYYDLTHLIPWPTQMEATLVTMTKYVHPSMYEGLSLSPGTCASAYRFNLGYLCLLYGQLGIVLFTLAVALYADFLRRQALPSMSRVGRLKATFWPLALARIALAGYVVQLVAKNLSASLAMKCFQATVAPTHFPASPPSLDPTTIFLIVTNMAVVRGTLARSSSAFRLGAGAAVMYLATTWPAVFGAWTAIDQYNLFTHAGCQKFFLGKVAWGQPDEHQAMLYCYYTRTSFIGELVIFAAMHAQLVACVLCFSFNMKRDLGAFNLAPPPNTQDLLYSSNPHAIDPVPPPVGSDASSPDSDRAHARHRKEQYREGPGVRSASNTTTSTADSDGYSKHRLGPRSDERGGLPFPQLSTGISPGVLQRAMTYGGRATSWGGAFAPGLATTRQEPAPSRTDVNARGLTGFE